MVYSEVTFADPKKQTTDPAFPSSSRHYRVLSVCWMDPARRPGHRQTLPLKVSQRPPWPNGLQIPQAPKGKGDTMRDAAGCGARGQKAARRGPKRRGGTHRIRIPQIEHARQPIGWWSRAKAVVTPPEGCCKANYQDPRGHLPNDTTHAATPYPYLASAGPPGHAQPMASTGWLAERV